jgi:putative transposase
MDIISLPACFRPLVSSIIWRHFSLIIPAILTMTGRITMSGISRRSEKGNSYRTIQRFCAAKLPWSEMLAEFVRHHLFNPNYEYILAGDTTTVTKSGSETHGINRFF